MNAHRPEGCTDLVGLRFLCPGPLGDADYQSTLTVLSADFPVYEAAPDLLEALEASLRYVRAEHMKCLNTMGGLSDAAFERYQKEPAYLRIKEDLERAEAALRKAGSVTE
jgi:hypothetical protein